MVARVCGMQGFEVWLDAFFSPAAGLAEVVLGSAECSPGTAALYGVSQFRGLPHLFQRLTGGSLAWLTAFMRQASGEFHGHCALSRGKAGQSGERAMQWEATIGS